MNAHQSQKALKRLIADAGLTIDLLPVAQGFSLMLDFYRRQRAGDCPPDDDGDMLLFQWGINDWGGGTFFELDLTRQFIISDSEDENIWQLSLTFKFLPSDELNRLGSGNEWCPDTDPRAVDNFEGFVRGTAAYQAASALKPVTIELDYFNAG